MKQRLFWLCGSGLSLLFGALDYGLFRQDTHIGRFVGKAFRITPIKDGHLYAFAAWYFPDYLWMLALVCMLFTVVMPQGRNTVFCYALAALYGCLWEMAQFFGLISGTADWWDILMYIMAVLTAAMINKLIMRRKT